MILRVSDLKKNYHQGKNEIQVLKGISFDLKAGETLAILGKSGSGKSTLLSMLSGLDRFDSGRIELDNSNLNDLNEEELTNLRAQKIGIIFQQYHLLSHLKALENVSLSLEIQGKQGNKEVKEEATKALENVGLSDRLNHFPDEMSGGEQQRVAVARSMVTSPKLLLADEPSGSLDAETGNKVMNLIFNLVLEAHMSMILVTHNLELANRCHRILHLEDGVLK